ncbi:MAG TPA: 2-dehydropantoate 2-reductase [Candidatus Baltobacteraceae bacterium]|nr:2-dehydropantoate 2-reductase [Candidatus Baltobacteraceae bacterium]
MRIGVFGAGGIGGFIAAALARAGEDVCVVARGAHLAAIRRDGLRVAAGDLGAFEVRVAAGDDLRTFDHLEYVLITFKAHQWGGVLPQFERALKQNTVFVTLQNGLPFWYSRDRALESVDPGGRVLETLPYDRILGGVVHASGHLAAPGLVHQSGGMLYPLGELDGRITKRLRRLCDAFENAGLHAPAERDIRAAIWRKLVNNTALNPVSALTRAGVHAMLRDPNVRALLYAIIEEGLAVARATGIDPGVDAAERLGWAEHLADVKTSMLQDLEAGKSLELEPICGAVVELARYHHLDVPHVESAYALCSLLEKTAK